MTAQDNLNPQQFYHGTATDEVLKPGEMITPGHPENFPVDDKTYPNPGKDVFFTSDDIHAMRYSQKVWARTGGSPRVYRVEPTGEYREHYNPISFRSSHPLKVLGEA